MGMGTYVVCGLLLLWVGWSIYSIVKNTKSGGCAGGCGGCSGCHHAAGSEEDSEKTE